MRDIGYTKQLLATVVPASFSITEVISGGNLMAATIAAGLAVLAGRWALKKQRLQAETAEIDKQIAELKLQRALDENVTK